MTRAYLESAASSSSSIGGSVMPSGWATVPDMVTSVSGWVGRRERGCGHAQRSSLLRRQSHEGDELVGGRSEERRVGKECRQQRLRHHYNAGVETNRIGGAE